MDFNIQSITKFKSQLSDTHAHTLYNNLVITSAEQTLHVTKMHKNIVQSMKGLLPYKYGFVLVIKQKRKDPSHGILPGNRHVLWI